MLNFHLWSQITLWKQREREMCCLRRRCWSEAALMGELNRLCLKESRSFECKHDKGMKSCSHRKHKLLTFGVLIPAWGKSSYLLNIWRRNCKQKFWSRHPSIDSKTILTFRLTVCIIRSSQRINSYYEDTNLTHVWQKSNSMCQANTWRCVMACKRACKRACISAV